MLKKVEKENEKVKSEIIKSKNSKVKSEIWAFFEFSILTFNF